MQLAAVTFDDTIDVIQEHFPTPLGDRLAEIRETLHEIANLWPILRDAPALLDARQATQELPRKADALEKSAKALCDDLSKTIAMKRAYRTGDQRRMLDDTLQIAGQCLLYVQKLAGIARSLSSDDEAVHPEYQLRHMSGKHLGRGRDRNMAAQTIAYLLASLWYDVFKVDAYAALGEDAEKGPSPFFRCVVEFCREANIASPPSHRDMTAAIKELKGDRKASKITVRR